MKQEVTELAQRPCSLFQILSDSSSSSAHAALVIGLFELLCDILEMAFKTAVQSCAVQLKCNLKEFHCNIVIIYITESLQIV